jgi:predicted permease
VIAEVTLSVVLLVCSGLLVRALWKVQDIDPGFKTDGVLALRTTLPLPKYASTAVRHQFYDRVLADVRALPGVTHAGYTSFLPLVMRGGIFAARVDGRNDDPASRKGIGLREVTPGYFATIGIPILGGRDISDGDAAGTPPVAVVSRSFVRDHWNDAVDPIGRMVTIGGSRHFRVVGVVGDIRFRGLELTSEPQVYIASRQVPDGNLSLYNPKDLVVRSAIDTTTLIASIREIVRKADPLQPVSDIQSLNDVVLSDTAPRRTQVRVLGAFAVIAFVLAAIGIHGVLAFNVSMRAREIGVRLALGAERKSILGMVLGHGFALATIGVVLGATVSVAAGRSMHTLLAGISPMDGVTLAAAILLTAAMTTVGSLLPALRAINVDPIQVIRTE